MWNIEKGASGNDHKTEHAQSEKSHSHKVWITKSEWAFLSKKLILLQITTKG